MAKRKFAETTAEAAVGGYQGIKKIRGLLLSLEIVDPPEGSGSDYGEPKEQMEFKLDDAVILEMFPNADDFDLKEGKFTGWVTYAALGKTPSSGSIYMKCLVASSEEIGKKKLSENIGNYVTLERQDRLLFKTKKDGETIEVRSADENGKPYSSAWCFVSDETADSETVKEYIKDLVIGLKENVALRELATNNRAKQFPEYKEACKAHELDKLLDVELVDGKFQTKGG